jgi:transposase
VDTRSFDLEVFTMPKSWPPYPAELRNKIVEVARAGRPIPEIAAQFEPAEQTIRNWIAQTDRDGEIWVRS